MPTNRLLAALAALALSAGVARASPPTVLTYSGFLMDSAGTAPLTGLHDFYFRFYTLATGGTQIGTGDITVSTTVGSDGFFSVVIDVSSIANDPLFRSQMYMSVRVDADVNPMTPRVQVTSAPGALSVPYGGITGFPTTQCGAGLFATGFDVNGNLVCASAQGGVTSVAAGTGVSVSGSTGAVTVSANLTTAGGDNGSSAVIARADHAHDARYVQPGALSAVGTINTPGNPVDWSQLKNVPAGLADGVDAVGLTAVSVGSGLTGDGTSGAPILLPTCATAGYALKWNGTAYACAPDVDTTYGAGAGLSLVGGSFTIASGGVTPAMLGAAAVGTAALANGAVTAAKLAPDAVTSIAIADGAVTFAKLAPDAVTSVAIADGAITFAKLHQNGCAANQFPRWDGARWVCSTSFNDVGCGPGQVLKWTGVEFACAPDDTGLGTVQTIMTSPDLTVDSVAGATLTSSGTLGLSSTGVAPGTYSIVSVDAQGRVVGGSAVENVWLQTAGLSYQIGEIAVSGNISTLSSFVGNLAGNASNASLANAVVNGSIVPDSLAASVLPTLGQVPSATFGGFSWVTPVTDVWSGTGIAVTGSAPNVTVSVDASVPLLASNQTFSGANTFTSPANSFSGNGAGLTGLNASNLASGTVPSGRVSGNYPGITQVGSLSGLDLTGDLNANSNVLRHAAPSAVAQSVTYQGASETQSMGASVSKSDGFISIHTGATAANYYDIRNNSSAVGWYSSGPGAFLSFRAYTYYIGGPAPYTNGHHAWVTAGGASHGTGSSTGGFGFHIYTSAGSRIIEGVVYGSGGTIAGSTVLVPAHTNNVSTYFAVNRGAGQIDFFVDGTLRGSVSTVGMNTTTFSTYGVRVGTDVASDAWFVLGQLTVGQGI